MPHPACNGGVWHKTIAIWAHSIGNADGHVKVRALVPVCVTEIFASMPDSCTFVRVFKKISGTQRIPVEYCLIIFRCVRDIFSAPGDSRVFLYRDQDESFHALAPCHIPNGSPPARGRQCGRDFGLCTHPESCHSRAGGKPSMCRHGANSSMSSGKTTLLNIFP